MFRSLSLISLFTMATAAAHAAPRCEEIFVDLRSLYSTIQLVHANPAMFDALTPRARRPLIALAGRSRDFDNAVTANKMLRALEKRVGAKTFNSLLGDHLSGVRRSHTAMHYNETEDRRDLNRTWGWKLLPDNDPVFNDPEYLRRMMEVSGQSGTGRYFDDGAMLPHELEDEFRKFVPQVAKLMRLTVSGTAANEVAFEIAASVSHHPDADMIVLDQAYVGVHGRTARYFMSRAGSHHLAVESPLTTSLHPDQAEIERLKPLEDAALERIRAYKTDKVGALFIEPIIGAKGVKFYRTEFLLRLQDLCEELKIPIIVDEILTGGGRTGKFFGYQHYEGFAPDFVTFGKGLQVAGVLALGRPITIQWSNGARTDYRPRYELPRELLGTTTFGSPEPMLKAIYIMRRIREGHLIENAARTGAYMLERLLARYEKQHNRWDTPPRGVGLLLYSNDKHLMSHTHSDRVMPHMTMTKEDIDDLMSLKSRGY